MNNIKRNILAAVGAVALLALALSVVVPRTTAGPALFGNTPAVNNPSGTSGLTSTGPGLNLITNGLYPVSMGGNGTTASVLTNATLLNVNPNAKDISFQFNGVSTNTSFGDPTNSIQLQIFRNLSGITPTNRLGGAPLDSSGNAIPMERVLLWSIASISNNVAFCITTNLSAANGQKGAVPYYYLWSVQCSSGTGLTNWQFWVDDD